MTSKADLPIDYNLPSIAESAGASNFYYVDGVLHCECDQPALDAAVSEYDHVAYVNPMKVKRFTEAVQSHMDAEAGKSGYDNIFTAVSYATSTHPTYGPEGVAFREWRDDVWTICHALLDDWAAGGAEPTIEEVLTSLPAITLP